MYILLLVCTSVHELQYEQNFTCILLSVLSEIAQQNEDESVSEEKREKRRKKVIKELFETEKTYLNHLELVNKVLIA